MKHIIYRTLCLPLATLSFLFASCGQDEVPGIHSEADLSLHITTRSTADGSTTEAGTSAENVYSTLRVMGFQSGTSLFDQTLTPAPSGITSFFPLRKADGTMDEVLGKKLLLAPTTLVAIANADGITLPVGGAPLADFEAIGYPGVASATKLNYFDATHHPLMVASTVNDFTTHTTAGIGLERTCAKLRVRVVNRTGDTGVTGGVTPPAKDNNYLVDQFYVSVLNVPASQKLLRPVAGTPVIADKNGLVDYPQAVAGDHKETDAAAIEWPYYCYVNESSQHIGANTELRTTIEIIVPYLVDKTTGAKNYYRYLLPLKQELKRNTIYELTVNIYGPGEVTGVVKVNAEIHIRIKAWDEITADPI